VATTILSWKEAKMGEFAAVVRRRVLRHRAPRGCR
jgi:hypothetical protein